MHHRQVTEAAVHLKTKGINHISISLIESVKSWLPEVVKAYREINTDTRIKIDHALSIAEIEKSFNDYDVNLAITNQFIENDKIISIPLYEESLIVALPKDNPFSNQKNVTLKDISDMPLIISHDGYQTRTEIVRAFNRIGLQANIGFEIERFELTSEFIKQSLGIAILPEKYALTLDERDVDIKEISDLSFYRIVYISIDKTRFLSPLTESFINLVLDYFDKGEVRDYFN
ncbi:MAG: LysR family transcriptional regulator substrate-binding protein [Jeotgalicoccus sp.]